MTVGGGRWGAGGRGVLAALALVSILFGVTERPATAAVTAVRGSAYGYYTKVGLLGGPQTLLGRGQNGLPPGPNVPPSTNPSYSPDVALPVNGSGGSMTATDGRGHRQVRPVGDLRREVALRP